MLELKMLGAPGYSTTYAFSGKEQIVHYMEQKKCHLGYLLIFDGRSRDFGKGLKPVETVGSSTVMVTFVDLRRNVKGEPEEVQRVSDQDRSGVDGVDEDVQTPMIKT